MNIQKNVPLSSYSSMKLGGKAAFLTEVNNPTELVEVLGWAKTNSQPPIVIGSGSNIIWQDSGYPGLVIVNQLKGFSVKEQSDGSFIVKVGAGEKWDDVVKRAVELSLSGIEALSAIPGTAGATPVQNVGAYGQEISNTLIEAEAYDLSRQQVIALSKADCNFGYRTSCFKTTDKGRFFITSLSLKLTKSNPKPPFYESLQKYLDQHNVASYTPQTIRDAVIAIRREKLPDPSIVANNGSFFANPIVEQSVFRQLSDTYSDIPNWPADSKVKVSAAWLVEHAGFSKDYHDKETGMSTWRNQALVLVNEHAHSTEDLLKFKHKIVDAVFKKFGVTLEQEPELI